jgi:sporulation protein YlmC with PRC-barrel domain
MNTGELFGKEVLDMNANSVGKVSDIEFDLGQGVISHIVVRAGLNKKYYVGIDKIEKVGDKVILKIDKDKIAKG